MCIRVNISRTLMKRVPKNCIQKILAIIESSIISVHFSSLKLNINLFPWDYLSTKYLLQKPNYYNT